MPTTAATREQVNLVLGRDSPIARRLRLAERVTGKSRTQITRSILETFLDAWLAAELSERRLLEAIRADTLRGLVGHPAPSRAAGGRGPGLPAGAAEDFRYLAYLSAARRLLEAPEGSPEWEQAAEALTAGFARDQGRTRLGRGGSLAAVWARLRERAALAEINP